MYYIIGTYRVKNRVIALKLFNPETKEIKLVDKKDVVRNAQLGKELYIGIERKVNSYGEEVIDITHHILNVRRLDEVDERGFPINERQAKLVLATKGYGSTTQVLVVDSMGKLETICYNDFIRLLDEKKIVGAKRSGFGTIEYHKHIIREDLILNKEEDTHHE